MFLLHYKFADGFRVYLSSLKVGHEGGGGYTNDKYSPFTVILKGLLLEKGEKLSPMLLECLSLFLFFF